VRACKDNPFYRTKGFELFPIVRFSNGFFAQYDQFPWCNKVITGTDLMLKMITKLASELLQLPNDGWTAMRYPVFKGL